MKMITFNNVNKVEFDVLQLGLVAKMYSKLAGLGFSSVKRVFDTTEDFCEYVFNFRSNDNVVVNAEITFEGKTKTARAQFEVFGVLRSNAELEFLVAAITKQMNEVFDAVSKMGCKKFIAEVVPTAYRFMTVTDEIGTLEAVM